MKSGAAIGIETKIPQKALAIAVARGIAVDSPTRALGKALARGLPKKLTMCHFDEIGVLFENSTA
ncbi:hypothetical protein [Kaistella sp.]|uniref:hypothetical protein n=1 Tax=Kaistella sp. TaxID=2782235 RepID=UPI003C34D3FF